MPEPRDGSLKARQGVFALLAPVELVLTFIPPSLKNNTTMLRLGNRVRSVPNDRVRAANDRIVHLARRVGRSFGRNEIAVEIVVDEARKRTLVRVEDRGPKTRPWVRDVQNVPEVPLDALQGVLYDDDRQVQEIACRYGSVVL